MRKSIAAVSLAAVSIAGLGAGFALGVPGVSSAQTSSTTAPSTTAPSTSGSSSSSSGGSSSTPAADPAADRTTRIAAALKPLVTDGTITEAQADKVTAALRAALPAGGRGGRDGPDGRGHGGRGGRGGFGAGLTVDATAIGVPEADLRTALQGGQTIAQVAQAHNVTADAVIAALTTDLQTRLDKEVAAGTITQAQADLRKADAATRFADLVNRSGPFGGHGPGRGADSDDPITTPATPSTTTA